VVTTPPPQARATPPETSDLELPYDHVASHFADGRRMHEIANSNESVNGSVNEDQSKHAYEDSDDNALASLSCVSQPSRGGATNL